MGGTRTRTGNWKVVPGAPLPYPGKGSRRIAGPVADRRTSRPSARRPAAPMPASAVSPYLCISCQGRHPFHSISSRLLKSGADPLEAGRAGRDPASGVCRRANGGSVRLVGRHESGRVPGPVTPAGRVVGEIASLRCCTTAKGSPRWDPANRFTSEGVEPRGIGDPRNPDIPSGPRTFVAAVPRGDTAIVAPWSPDPASCRPLRSDSDLILLVHMPSRPLPAAEVWARSLAFQALSGALIEHHTRPIVVVGVTSAQGLRDHPQTSEAGLPIC